MPKWLKYVAAALAALVALAMALFGGAVWMGERKRERVVDVRVVPVAYTKDAAALRHGKYLFESRGCGECHGMDGRGRVIIDKGGMYVRSPNITPAKGSVVADYNEGDWVRAIRHGVNVRGRPLLIMPSEDYNRLTDADLAAIVAYTRSLPPLEGVTAEVRFPLQVTALYGAGVIPDAAQKIDHRLPPAQPVPVAANATYGEYVANMCKGCHGQALAGGPVPGGPPDWPPAADLRSVSPVMARYDTPDKFSAMMRTGRRPDGTEVSKVMPFETFRNMNDLDLQAMHAYLRTLAAGKAGGG